MTESGSSYRVMGTERVLNNIVCSHSDFPWFTVLVTCCFCFYYKFICRCFFSYVLQYWNYKLWLSIEFSPYRHHVGKFGKITFKKNFKIVIFQSWKKKSWEILILKITSSTTSALKPTFFLACSYCILLFWEASYLGVSFTVSKQLWQIA